MKPVVRRLMAFGLTLGLAFGAPGRAASAAGTPSSDGVRVTTVCFTAHNGDDPEPVTLTGTLFTHGQLTADTPLILAVHGFASDRRVWDGAMSGSRIAGSFARSLAGQGYAVLTYDRLGYGDSPYPRPAGAGYGITLDNQLAALHEVVQAVHDGSFGIGRPSCANPRPLGVGVHTVVVAGHSAAAWLVAAYAGTYHDVAGVVYLAAATLGVDQSVIDDVIAPWVVPQLQSGHDYVTFMPPGDSGVSPQCLHYLFYGSSPVATGFCRNSNLVPNPGGEWISAGDFPNLARARIASIGDIPVLLGFADHDRVFVGPAEAGADHADHVTPEIDYWQQNCGCQLATYTQPDAGHFMLLEPSLPQLTAEVVAWLHDNGI